jgi:undecaprenyl-diphosphatase
MNRKKILLIVLGSLLLFSIALFVVVANEMVVEKEDKLDLMIFHFMKGYLSPFVVTTFTLLTFFGSTLFLVSCYLDLSVVLFLFKKRKEALSVVIAGIVSFILLEGLRLIFKRLRPEMPVLTGADNYSFPSGHAFYSFVFYSAIALLIWKAGWSRKWKIIFSIGLSLFVLLIGLSRIVLRYHFASDVVAGFSLGLACLSLYLIWTVIVKKS